VRRLASIVSASPEFTTHGLQLVDLTRNGNLDILTTSNQQNSFATMFGNGRGGFSSPGPAATFLRVMDAMLSLW